MQTNTLLYSIEGILMKNILTLLTLLLLSGCELLIPKGDYFSESNNFQSKEGMAIVYFYRVGNQEAAEAGAVNIYVDDEKIFNVVNKGYTVFNLKPNTYTFKAKWSWHDKPLFEGGLYDEKNLTLLVEANKTYYLNYQINEVAGSTYDAVGLLGKMAEPRSKDASVEIVDEPKLTAIKKLQQCRFQENLLSK